MTTPTQTSYEIREICENNLGVFATKPIKKGEIIFRETPFYSSGMEKMMYDGFPPFLELKKM